MYRNILVIRTDRLGDVVLTTPALRALRKKFPEARITLLLAPLTKELVEGNPYIDQILIDDRRCTHKGWLGYIKLVNRLRQEHFDLVINYHTKKRTNLLCWFAGIPVRIGYRNDKFGFLLNKPVPDRRPAGEKHEARYCLDVLKVLGISGEALELYVATKDDNDKWAEDWLKSRQLPIEGKIVAVHPGSSCPTKQWPVERFVELIRILRSRYQTEIVLVGGADGRKAAAQIQNEVQGPLFSLVGETSVGQLTSLLKKCALLISNDSGPVHIAAALGTPVVSIFTRNQPGINPERWCPLGPKSRYVAPPVDMSLSFAQGTIDHPDFLYKMTVKDVLLAVDALYKLC